jgi:hypothetical protein
MDMEGSGKLQVKVKLSLCLILRHEDIWWSRCTDPRILNLGINWRWSASRHPRVPIA